MPDRQRHIRPGRLLTAVVAVLAVGVTGAGLAWACTPDAVLDDLSAVAGPPGTKVKVSGGHFPVKLGSRAEVRLDSSAKGPISVDGPLLGCAGQCPEESPVTVPLNHRGALKASFSGMEIKIPDRRPGVYRIVALGYDNEGFRKDDGEAVQMFEITERAKDTGPGEGNASPPPPGPANPTDDRDLTRERSAPGAGSPDTTARSDRPTTGSSGSGGTALTRGAGDPSRAGDPSPNGGARREGSGDLGLVAGPSGQPLFKGSLPSPALTDARRFGQPSGRSASGDLWSGFGSGRTPSLDTRRSADPAAAEDGGLDLGLAAGTGFLGLGLAALFGSFLVAEVRRRRKAVRA